MDLYENNGASVPTWIRRGMGCGGSLTQYFHIVDLDNGSFTITFRWCCYVYHDQGRSECVEFCLIPCHRRRSRRTGERILCVRPLYRRRRQVLL